LTLRGLDKSRIWWAATNAPLEYEDALLDAFADGVASEVRQAAPEPQLVLPFAVRRRPTGERRRHGITDALLGEVPAPDPVPGRSASGAPSRSRATSPRRADGQPRRTPAPRRPRISEPATRRADTAVHLSPEGLEQLRVELRQLREISRPAAVKRLVAARELGDLKENGDYIAAREELGFIDGRLQMLDNRLQNVVVADGPTTAVASLGSTVVVRIDDMVLEYRLVGSPEADVGAGRISTSSPVGRALVGHVAGDEVVVTTPGGEQRFSIVEVR
jgi:transcription elongation factor GreA